MNDKKSIPKPRARPNYTPPALATDQAPLRSLQHTAERLGVSIHTLRAWIFRREIPYVKVGRAVRISDTVIDRIIANGTHAAHTERF